MDDFLDLSLEGSLDRFDLFELPNMATSWWGQLYLDGLIATSDVCICGTFLTVCMKLQTSRSGAALSLQTMCAIVGARTLHVLSHPIGVHYLPSVLPWSLFATMDALNACLGLACLWFFLTYYYPSYEREKDNFGIQLVHRLGDLGVVPKTQMFQTGPLAAGIFLYSAVILGAFGWYLVRRSPLSFACSYFCCFYEVLTALALLPQLWMFYQDKRVSNLLANFVVFTALNRLCTLCFWISYPWVYTYRYPDNRGNQIVSEILNLIILSDFLYFWAKSKLKGQSVVIIEDASAAV
mmetsp:Transcript_23496/g.43276  ORF Transcript_23496/g.43276 Transcript_23496/m.43276 type:complete len:294 (+) Transcript_23496:31-912(+)